MKLKKYSQLFEADIKKTLPEDYIRDVRRRAAPYMGGPTRREIMEVMQLMDNIFRIQKGHEEELTEIGKKIILDHYAKMLEDVELDIKIVDPDDEEKMEMAMKMQEEQEKEPQYPTVEIPIKVPQEEIDRRKIVNNVMQGEAQNVHSMMFTAKEDIDKINPELLNMYMRHLELNRKFDWDENRPDLSQFMQDNPEMANCMDTDYEGEEGSEKPTIKVRVLDLPMLIHETVKGIYELMSHKAIPQDPVIAQELIKLTDTLKDEEEDIKYGPFIAADLRDYIVGFLDRTENERTQILPNLREFIFSKMMDLQPNVFVELIKNILMKKTDEADKLMEDNNIVKDAISDVNYEEPTTYQEPTYQEPEGDDSDLADLINKPKEPVVQEKPEEKKKPWFEYSKGELNNFLNDAIDKQDWTIAREIQKAIERKEQNNR